MSESIKQNVLDHSVGSRVREIKKRIKHIGESEKHILARAGKVREVEQNPSSISTTLPRREKGFCDINLKKRKNKIETATKALKMSEPLSPSDTRIIQQATQRKKQREEIIFQNGLQKTPSNMDKKGAQVRKPSRTKHRARSAIQNVEDDRAENVSPKKASRTNRRRTAKQEEKNTSMNYTGENGDKTNTIIEIESSGDENETITHDMQVKPTLYNLNQEDLSSIQTEHSLMRGKCVQAIIELIHDEKAREDITCVSTDLYPLLMQNKMKEAKFLVHADEEYKTGEKGDWITPKSRRATAQSRVLLIPCHAITGTEMHHWFLTIKIKLDGDKQEIIVIDSLGRNSGDKHNKNIRKKLIKMGMIKKKDKCTALNVIQQTEVECGIRMAAYIMLFRKIDFQQTSYTEIIARIKGYVARERNFKGNLAAHRRKTIHTLVKNAQEQITK